MTQLLKVHLFAFHYHYIHAYLTRSHAQSFQQGEESNLELYSLEMT
jgi:hypothetical protein